MTASPEAPFNFSMAYTIIAPYVPEEKRENKIEKTDTIYGK